MSPTYFKFILLGLILLDYGWSLIHYFLAAAQRKKPLPDCVKGVYDGEQYGRWVAYTKEKKRMGFYHNIFMTLFTLAIFAFDLLAVVYNAIGVTGTWGAVILMLVFSAVSHLLEIPTGAWISTTMHGLQCQRRSLLITVLALLLAVLLALGGIGMYARQILERMEYVLYGGFGSLASNYAVSVSMTELIATPERYHGVRVRLIAVGNLEFEGNYISTDKEAWENHTTDKIWVELGEELQPYYEELQRYNGEYVIIEGVFDMYDKGHFAMFQGALHDVDRYELWNL